MTNNNLDHLHLKLKIRRTLLHARGNTEYRNSLRLFYPTTTPELFDAVVAECIAEGTIKETFGRQGASLLTWHEQVITERVAHA